MGERPSLTELFLKNIEMFQMRFLEVSSGIRGL